MPDVAALIDAIRQKPDDGTRWLARASWYWDHGRDDEAAVVRVFWTTLRDNLARVSLDMTLADVARHAKLLEQRAREVEERRDGGR